MFSYLFLIPPSLTNNNILENEEVREVIWSSFLISMFLNNLKPKEYFL